MRRLKLDARGNIREFAAVPLPIAHSDQPSEPIDWKEILTPDVLGYDLSSLQPAEWRMPPGDPADEIQSWEGSWPGTDDRIYLQAATFRGRLSHLRYYTRWKIEATAKPVTQRNSTRVRIEVFVQVLAIIGAGVVAFRNITTGRGDSKATKPLATWSFALMMLLWLFKASHVQHEDEYGLFLAGINSAAGYALLVMMIYFAFEPMVRRRSPELLVAWTRLLRLRINDCLVGRDILVGCCVAALSAAMCDLASLGGWFAPRELIPNSLGGLETAIFTSIESHVDGLTVAMLCLAMYLLVFVTVRSKSLTIFVLAALIGLNESLTNRAVPLGWIVAGLIGFGQIWSFVNYGLLLSVITLSVFEMLKHPITSDTERFYFGGGVMVLGLVIALAAFGYRVATGTRSKLSF